MDSRPRVVTADLTITPDMLRRWRLRDVASRWARNLCELVATTLLVLAVLGWALALTTQSVGGGQ